MESRHIEIVGAGPAGLIAAITLAKAGYETTVYEAKPEVAYRLHGSLQGLENWSSDEDVVETIERLGVNLKVSPDLICQPYKRVTVYNSNLHGRVTQSKKPIFYIVRRGGAEECLDRFLMRTALDTGVTVLFNHRKDKLEYGGIVASGPSRIDVIAKGVTFKTGLEDMAVGIVDYNLAPGGYAYLLVCEGRGTIATVLYNNFNRKKECFKRTIDAFRRVVSFDMRDEKEFAGYGNFFFGKPAYENGRYYVGEAAGLQDCLWGFGMRYAMESGYLAARSIIEKKDYGELLKERLLPLQRASLVNRFFYTRLGNWGYNYLIRSLAGEDVVEGLNRYYNLSFLKRLVDPVVGWSCKNRQGRTI